MPTQHSCGRAYYFAALTRVVCFLSCVPRQDTLIVLSPAFGRLDTRLASMTGWYYPTSPGVCPYPLVPSVAGSSLCDSTLAAELGLLPLRTPSLAVMGGLLIIVLLEAAASPTVLAWVRRGRGGGGRAAARCRRRSWCSSAWRSWARARGSW